MSFPDYKYGTGLGNVGSYQVSGKPFASTVTAPASGATNFHKFDFPSVTKEITIINNGPTIKPVRVAFAHFGLDANYILVHPTLDGVGPTTLNVKATELYVMSNDSATPSVSVYASLTNVPIERVNNASPTGSNWSGSLGVG